MPDMYILEDDESHKSPLMNNKNISSNLANTNQAITMTGANPNKPKKR